MEPQKALHLGFTQHTVSFLDCSHRPTLRRLNTSVEHFGANRFCDLSRAPEAHSRVIVRSLSTQQTYCSLTQAIKLAPPDLSCASEAHSRVTSHCEITQHTTNLMIAHTGHLVGASRPQLHIRGPLTCHESLPSCWRLQTFSCAPEAHSRVMSHCEITQHTANLMFAHTGHLVGASRPQLRIRGPPTSVEAAQHLGPEGSV
eukprot:1157385-Pelagomonas_calceolata.AAC.7